MKEKILDIIKDNFAIIITTINGLIVSYMVILGNWFMKNKEYNISLKQVEVNKINEEFEVFYYPILLLIRRNRILYDILTYDKVKDSRTLIKLLENEEYCNNDKILLSEIIETNNKINELIISNKGIINGEISEKLANASVHFTLIDMAYNRKIQMEISKFEKSVYPRDLQDLIENEVKMLTIRRDKLKSKS